MLSRGSSAVTHRVTKAYSDLLHMPPTPHASHSLGSAVTQNMLFLAMMERLASIRGIFNYKTYEGNKFIFSFKCAQWEKNNKALPSGKWFSLD